MKKFLATILLFALAVAMSVSMMGCQSTSDPLSDPKADPSAPAEETTPSTAVTTNSVADREAMLEKMNRLREDYDYGTCRELCGDVSVVLFYMNDFESVWTAAEIDRFTEQEVKPALAFLEQEAKVYGVELRLHVRDTYSSLTYDDDVIVDIKGTGLATIDVLKQAALGVGFSRTEDMIQHFRSRYQTEEVVCFTLFNKNGTAYGINPKRGTTPQVDEHCIIFSHDLYAWGNAAAGSQASVIAHEMLHLFGAEDYYAGASRKELAQTYYENDIMLSTKYDIGENTIGKATAFYIGWLDKAPVPLYYEGWNQ